MLNFAEQTGSGAVIVVWYYLLTNTVLKYIYPASKTPTTISTLTTPLTPLSNQCIPSALYIWKSMRLQQDCIQQTKHKDNSYLVLLLRRGGSLLQRSGHRNLFSFWKWKHCGCLPQYSLVFSTLLWLVFATFETTILRHILYKEIKKYTQPKKNKQQHNTHNHTSFLLSFLLTWLCFFLQRKRK